MQILAGHPQHGKPNLVCKLHKSIYSLKHVGRNWFFTLCSALLDIGFQQSHAEYSLFVIHQGIALAYLIIYVNDLILIGNDISLLVDRAITLGIEVARSTSGTNLNQHKYTIDILTNASISSARLIHTPMEPNIYLADDGGKLYDDLGYYLCLINHLIYLTITRLDITFTINVLVNSFKLHGYRVGRP